MNLGTIAPNGAFLDALAADWLDRAGGDALAVANGLILLPTRRAARALGDAFLHAAGGRPLLLPRIAAIGAPDEAQLALTGMFALSAGGARPDAAGPAHPAGHGAGRSLRRAHQRRPGLDARRRTGRLMDEAERAEVDLATVLPGLAAEDYATHWGITLDFLRIVTAAWPAWLADNGLMNPAARQVALLDTLAAEWTRQAPATPVLAAGSTGGIPAVARLLGVVARLPNGRVVLPGLDLDMADPAWDAMADSHPQCALRTLLARIGAARGDVSRVPAPEAAPPSRPALLHRALLPATALGQWRSREPCAPDGMWRLRPADQQEESGRHRPGAARRAGAARPPRRPGDPRSRPVRPRRRRTGAVRRRGRRQRRREAARHPARRLPAPAGPGGRRNAAPRPAAVAC